MTKTIAVDSASAQRYASALIESVSEKDYSKIEKESDALLEAIDASDDLQNVMSNPLFSTEDKVEIFAALCKKMGASGTFINFLKTIAQNGRAAAIPQILKTVLHRLDEIQGIIPAKVETAYPLSKAQTTAVEKEIGEMTGGKAKISVKVNPDLIGGMVITIGSQRIDSSIKRRLELLEQDLRESANENLELPKKTAPKKSA